jgi:hypothetical protein
LLTVSSSASRSSISQVIGPTIHQSLTIHWCVGCSGLMWVKLRHHISCLPGKHTVGSDYQIVACDGPSVLTDGLAFSFVHAGGWSANRDAVSTTNVARLVRLLFDM